MKNESSKIVIITGANGGIGFEIAKAFLEENATVLLPYRANRNNIKQLIDKYGENRVYDFQLNLNSMTLIQEFIEKVEEHFGHIDTLVNNAGITRPTPLEEVTEENWDDMLEINLKGPFFLSQKVFPLMRKVSGGTIINIASWSGHEASPGMGAYSISKAGMVMMTKHMALEWAPYNIRVNTVSPGLIRTPISEKFYQNEEIHKQRVEFVPLKRIGEGKDIANLVTFLSSVKGSYITGQSIVVDGGLIGSIHAHLAGPPQEQMRKNRNNQVLVAGRENNEKL